MKPLIRTVGLAFAAALATACASVGGGGGTDTSGGVGPGAGQVSSPSIIWPVKTREHVDLWLHGYALLTADTARIPFFRRGYRQRADVSGQRFRAQA